MIPAMTAARHWVAKAFGKPEVLDEIIVERPEPGPGEVTVAVRAVGMNPADYKIFASGEDQALLPMPIGFEVAGTIARLGPDTQIGSGGGAVGDVVVAFQLSDGYSTSLNAPAGDVFSKPPALSFAEAANLLLVGTTAADAINVIGLSGGETVLVHGAAGAVGTSVLQQALALGAKVIGTASERNFEAVRRFGATPVAYGSGLEARVRAAGRDGIDASIDTVGTDEAVDVSLALVADRRRIVTIAAFERARQDGFPFVGRDNPRSQPFREAARESILALAAAGKLTVPIGQTYPFDQAPVALAALQGRHPYGKLSLVVS
jgi:NADPH:quinone reductase-like Zn-dependent oxidoreductase